MIKFNGSGKISKDIRDGHIHLYDTINFDDAIV